MEELLKTLFEQGQLHFTSAPEPAKATRGTNRLLEQSFATDLLSIAGPLLEINLNLAIEAANYLQQSAWLLVNRDEHASQAAKRLDTLSAPHSADDIASADLVLRFLPNLYQRALAISPEDVLAQHLRQTLLLWPLSGVLADIPDPPQAPLHFFGHRGLQLRYAERLAQRPRPGWAPTDSASLDAVMLVFELKQLSLDLLKDITVPANQVPTEDTNE